MRRSARGCAGRLRGALIRGMRWRGTTPKDWLLLLGSAVFVAAGLWGMSRGGDVSATVAATAFFGACGALAVHKIADKLAIQRVLDDPDFSPRIPGGVPLVATRRGVALASVGLVALGLLMASTGGAIGRGFVVVSLLMAGLGGVVLILIAVKRGHVQSLTFTPEGLRVRDGSLRYLAPWDGVSIELVTLFDQPFAAVYLRQVSAVLAAAEVTDGDPQRARKKLARRLESSRARGGSHLLFPGGLYGTDAATLMRTMAHYVDHPEARAELGATARTAPPEERSVETAS